MEESKKQIVLQECMYFLNQFILELHRHKDYHHFQTINWIILQRAIYTYTHIPDKILTNQLSTLFDCNINSDNSSNNKSSSSYDNQPLSNNELLEFEHLPSYLYSYSIELSPIYESIDDDTDYQLFLKKQLIYQHQDIYPEPYIFHEDDDYLLDELKSVNFVGKQNE